MTASQSFIETAQSAYLGNWVSFWANETPSSTALSVGTTRLTYPELDTAIAATAAGLIAKGVSKGDRVAVLDAPSLDSMILFLAAMEVGAIFLGLNPRYQKAELFQQIDDSDPSIILVRRKIGKRDYHDDLDGAGGQLVWLPVDSGDFSLADVLPSGDLSIVAERKAERAPDDPCMLVYTSGSTGVPKGALLPHQALTHFASRQVELWPLKAPSLVNYFPINHIGSLIDAAAFCLVSGGCQHVMAQFDAAQCLDIMEKERISMWITVPSVMHMIASLPDFDDRDLSGLELIVWEGAAIPEPLFERLYARGLPMATNYGMTETSSAITALPPTRDRDLLMKTVGFAFPGSDVRLSTEAGREGEVEVKSPANFIGYWNRPDATSESFSGDGYFRTGDVARQREDGAFQLVGRIKEMFKSGGYNVYPLEVEAKLQQCPGVEEVIVVAVEEETWGEVGFAFMVGDQAEASRHLPDFCRSNLANFKIPKHFEWVDALPILPIGKVDRPQLKKRAADLFGAAG